MVGTAIRIVTATTGMAATGATMTGGKRTMTGAITTGVRTMNIAIVTIITVMTIIARGRTGSTINTNPASWRGCLLLLVTLKHQLVFS